MATYLASVQEGHPYEFKLEVAAHERGDAILSAVQVARQSRAVLPLAVKKAYPGLPARLHGIAPPDEKWRSIRIKVVVHAGAHAKLTFSSDTHEARSVNLSQESAEYWVAVVSEGQE
jgi:hypothetical protein